MKKAIQSLALFALTTLFVSFASAQANDEAIIGKARGAAHECLQDFQGPTFEISAGVETTGICIVEGFLKRVTFYAGPECHGPNPCPKFPTRPIAYVDLDCENNVIGVTCLF